MHGIKRTRLGPQAAELKRQKENEKIDNYVALRDEVLARKAKNDLSEEALVQTNALLDLNPEFYSVWNYRRTILLRGIRPNIDDEGYVKLLISDIRLTTAYLQVHPKVYWIWTHRKWCLASVPPGPDGTEQWRNDLWRKELGLVETLLDADPRNFHAWTYRRHVLASLPETFTPRPTAEDEIRYTRKKIEANFSNYSAWHCRSKVLGGLWASLPTEQVRTERDSELELVRNALWTDPGDQSGWLYHRWLIGERPDPDLLENEIASIKELYEVEPDSKWCMNALASYLTLEMRLSGLSDATRNEANALLARLVEVDPDRQERYREVTGAGAD